MDGELLLVSWAAVGKALDFGVSLFLAAVVLICLFRGFTDCGDK